MEPTPAPARFFRIHLSTAVILLIQASIVFPPVLIAANDFEEGHISTDGTILAVVICLPLLVLMVVACEHRIRQEKEARGLMGIALIAALSLATMLPAMGILNRKKMARHQTSAAAACKAFAEAQEVYRRTDYDGDGLLEYAQSLKGNFSLFENSTGTGDLALIPKAIADAEWNTPNVKPYNGYVFKLLTAQGKDATGGARNYIINGNMVLGYGLAACPVEYDVTGRDIFIINNNGTIFQKDCGPDSLSIFKTMTEFNPHTVWYTD